MIIEDTFLAKPSDFCKVFNSPILGQIVIFFGEEDDENDEDKANNGFFEIFVSHRKFGLISKHEDIETLADFEKYRSLFKNMNAELAESYARSCIEDLEAESQDDDIRSKVGNESAFLAFYYLIGKPLLFLLLICAFIASFNKMYETLKLMM